MKRQILRMVGYILQSLALGMLLAMAVVKMVAMAGGATVFRYEGF